MQIGQMPSHYFFLALIEENGSSFSVPVQAKVINISLWITYPLTNGGYRVIL